MPKRKKEDYDRLDSIKKKLKKLERNLKKKAGRKRIKIISSSDSEDPEYLQANKENEEERNSQIRLDQTSGNCPIQWTEETEGDRPPSNETETAVLDQLMIDILGKDPSMTDSIGKDIQKDLAIHMNHIATTGLPRDTRKELIESHKTPGNCRFIAAPALNPEIKVAITESVLKRDKALEAKQKQLSSAITCLGDAITLMAQKEDRDPIILKLMTNTGRLLCDSLYNESVTRRNFMLSVLKKDLKEQMQLTKIDNFLFGNQLAESLKTAKAINKSGAELKPNQSNQSMNKTKQYPQKLQPFQTPKNLTWKAPALSHRQTGPPRAKESAASRQLVHSSRTSHLSSNRSRRT